VPGFGGIKDYLDREWQADFKDLALFDTFSFRPQHGARQRTTPK
jgi:hypothetical protein